MLLGFGHVGLHGNILWRLVFQTVRPWVGYWETTVGNLSEGEAAARGGDGSAEFFGSFKPFLNDDFVFSHRLLPPNGTQLWHHRS